MNLIIGGGVHEHGRNCFYVGSDVNYIVDCGIMRGADYPFPHLSQKNISAAKYLFLTHPHEDHTGAFHWLIKNGFKGIVIATRQTLSAIPYYQPAVEISEKQHRLNLGDAIVSCGKSGHCAGAVWYEIKTRESKVLFSGDYCEDTCFSVDKIRKRTADIALLDCAFGNIDYDRNTQARKILSYAENALNKGSLLLPVPKNGRGADLICLLSDLNCNFIVDGKLCEYFLGRENEGWISKTAMEKIMKALFRKNVPKIPCIILISDARLNSGEGENAAQNILQTGGSILLTGHIDEGSGAQKLLNESKAEYIPYNAHCCKRDADKLIDCNNFKKIILCHSADI